MGQINTRPFRVLIAAIAFLIVAQVLQNIGSLISSSYYTHPDYQHLWNPIMLSASTAGYGVYFFVTNVAFGFISALLFVIVYTVVGRGLNGGAEKGMHFGLLVFLVAVVPYSLSMLMLLSIPDIIIVLWAFQSLVLYVVGGLIMGIILEKKIAKTRKKRVY
jgi:hypothetical protein